ncbi:DUF4244 domain-containing protein [Nonomuraea sp. LP-02]|uniref:DUF4244 domain-containing protein n=1 Tax=Nonomuraea sp. LP-02 TaxID=3097960 RepID=UPI002E31E029|nr:DUF4244 domain-containing protein [Nonomuraea sp. LP-02]MED7928285.1 DUF4244 domain-containing protein [Nonomuraea sp. LP-02]
MHSPAPTPDATTYVPEAAATPPPPTTALKRNHDSLTQPPTSRSAPRASRALAAHDDTTTTAPTSPVHTAPTPEHTAPKTGDLQAPSAGGPGTDGHTTRARNPRHPSPHPRSNKWLHYAATNRERGMSTAEYAVGTIAACAFAALLMKIVSGTEVADLLTGIISRALKTDA